MHGFLVQLLLLIGLAALGVALFERLRLPPIAGFLVIGALVGPGGLALVPDVDRVRELAELGVVFLLFEIGLELPLERLRRLWRGAILAGGLQVALTLLCVAGLSGSLGLQIPEALVMGALVAMSSTALVMRVLSDRGEIDAPQGQLAVGILLFQDLCIVPFLLLVPILATGVSPDAVPDLRGLLQSLVALAAFLVGAWYGLPFVLDRAARLQSRDLFTLLAVLSVLGSAVIAERIGLTLSVGAFVGGLVLSRSPYAHQVFAEVVPLRGVLIGLFFTAVGMFFEPAVAWSQAPAVLAYSGGVLVLKSALIIVIVAFVLRQGLRVGLLTGLALAQTGEFSFVLAAVAAESGLLDASLHQVFVAGSVITLVATPFLVQLAPTLARGLGASTRSGADDSTGARRGLTGHAVLVGFGLAGRNLARVLRARGIPYLAVDANAQSVRESQERGEPVLYGDATRREILLRLEVAGARLVMVAVSDPLATLEVVRRVHELTSDACILVRTRYIRAVDPLYAAGATLVVSEEFESNLELLAEALKIFGVSEGAISRFVGELRDEGYELMRAPPAVGLDPWLVEMLEQVSSEWVEVPDSFGPEATLETLNVRAATGANILAVERNGETQAGPPPGYLLQPGDRLLVVAAPGDVERLRVLLIAEH